MSIAEKLATIAENQKKVYWAGAEDFGLKGKQVGNPIRIDDSNPVHHEMSVSLRSKNLLPFPYYDGGVGASKTANGVTWTVNGDGSVTANGTPTGYTAFTFARGAVLPKETFTISVTPQPVSNVLFEIVLWDKNEETVYNKSFDNEVTINPASYPNATQYCFYVYQRTNGVSISCTLSVQIELGTTATAYTPFVDVNGESVQKYGKNLLRIPDSVKPYASTLTQTMENGIVSLKGTITLSGVSSVAYNPLTGNRAANYVRATTISLEYGAFRLPRGSYAFSESQNDFSYMIVGKLGTSYWNGGAKLCSANCSFEVTDDETYGLYLWQIDVPTKEQEYSIEYTVSYPQLELNTTATEYEPYVEPTTYTADENGNVNGIIGNGESMTLMADSGVVISAEYYRDARKWYKI